MGCDIHLYAERRERDRWVTLDHWVRGDSELDVPYKKLFYSNRNYNLFSILADVRNGSGFAGSKTGDGFVPIAAPRGVPEDACAEYKEVVASMNGDGHSHSWFTVAELMAYDWTQEATLSGIVDLHGLGRWKINGRPDQWSSVISGQGIKIFPSPKLESVESCFAHGANWWTLYHSPANIFGNLEKSNDEKWLRTLANIQAKFGCERPHFQVAWKRKYYQVASEFLSETLPRLWRCGSPDDVRITFFFFFDN